MWRCDCPPDDCAERVRRYLNKDRSAGDELARKFAPLVRAAVVRALGRFRRADWEDAQQAIFLRVFANLAKWDGRCPFCNWLAVVAARRAIDSARTLGPSGVPLSEIADRRTPPPSAEAIECLEKSIAELPPEWLEVYELTMRGLPREQVARLSGKSRRTVQYWLAEIRHRLARCLDD
jgi:RNA polymerase sigma factor (sigma-70 family)